METDDETIEDDKQKDLAAGGVAFVIMVMAWAALAVAAVVGVVWLFWSTLRPLELTIVRHWILAFLAAGSAWLVVSYKKRSSR